MTSTTLSITWVYNRVPRDREPYVQERIPHWYGALTDPDTGRWIDSHVMNQDFIAWVGQGAIADRTQEHLGLSDRGIVMIRQRFLAELEAIARGEEPKGVIRDAAKNECVRAADRRARQYLEGRTLAEIEADPRHDQATPRSYPYQAGQPEGIARPTNRPWASSCRSSSVDALNLR